MRPTDETEAGQANTSHDKQWLRQIPSVEKFLASEELQPLINEHGRGPVKEILVEYLVSVRSGPGAGDFSVGTAIAEVSSRLALAAQASLRRVINGTGVIIHTNLGRSPIDDAIWRDAAALIAGYSNLEFDLDSGERGSRDSHLSAVATRLFGCEAALLVNNNAAGVMLLLAAVAAGKEVVVSRGELVEIGGGFRVPDVMEQ
jgi:Selenocysteine synthase [seryl-tRNASer selenium transferase]